MQTLMESCHLGANSPLELVGILESRRESAGVSIHIMIRTLLRGIPVRTYKCWLTLLATGKHSKNAYAPHCSRHPALVRAIKSIDIALDNDVLPVTRAEVYAKGHRMTKYKSDALLVALKSIPSI